MGMAAVVLLMISGGMWDSLFASDEASVGPFAFTVQTLSSSAASSLSHLAAFNFVASIREVIYVPADILIPLWSDHFMFLLVFGLWFLIIWTIFGGMICRSAACEFAAHLSVPWTEALAFSLSRFTHLIGAFLLPGVILALGVIMLACGGLLLQVPGVNIIAGVLYGLAMFLGFVISAVGLLALFAGSIFIPTIAVESTDAADTLARTFSYVKNRPLHFALYVVLATFLGIVTFFFVHLLTTLAINTTAAASSMFVPSDLADYASIGVNDLRRITSEEEAIEFGRRLRSMNGRVTLNIIPTEAPETLFQGTDAYTAWFIYLWRTLAGGLLAGFVVSYLFSAKTVVYFLMRKATDDQDLDEIWLPGMIHGTLAPVRESEPHDVTVDGLA